MTNRQLSLAAAVAIGLLMCAAAIAESDALADLWEPLLVIVLTGAAVVFATMGYAYMRSVKR